jgi:hypothetical protein
MAAVKGPHISMPGRAFWGLVVQKGPWKSTYGDYLRAHEVPGGALGGGIQVGGTGEGKQDSVMTPYQMNGRNALPEPSEHATQSIVLPGESWFIKKPQPGSKLPSPLKAALTIKHSKERDYEDISHKKGGEPNVPPPPADIKTTFVTEQRLARSRNKLGLTIVTRNLPRYDISSQVVTPPMAPPSYSTGIAPSFRSSSGRPMSLDTPPAPVGPRIAEVTPLSGRPMSLDTPLSARPMSIDLSGFPVSVDTPSSGIPMSIDTPPSLLSASSASVGYPSLPSPYSVSKESTFTPPSIDLSESYKNIDDELRKLREIMEKRQLTVNTNLDYYKMGASAEPKPYDEVPNLLKRKMAAENESGRSKKGKLSKPLPPAIQTKNLSKYSNVGLLDLQGAAAPKDYDEVPNLLKRKQKNGAESGRSKKGKLAPKRKPPKPSRITTTNLPPSLQSSTKARGTKIPKEEEDFYKPKKKDAVPDLTTVGGRVRRRRQ